MIKKQKNQSVYLFTFSSVYKVLQFLEVYNFLTVPSPPILAQAPKTSDKDLPSPVELKKAPSVDFGGRKLRVLVLTFNMNRK
jgi:hypothetical protein